MTSGYVTIGWRVGTRAEVPSKEDGDAYKQAGAAEHKEERAQATLAE